MTLQRRRGLALLPRDGVYGRVEGELLIHEPGADLVTLDGYALFSSVGLMQTSLHAETKARRRATQTFDHITASVAIDGGEELRRAVADDPAMRAKLLSISRTLEADPQLAGHLRTEELVAFAERNPAYGIALGEVDGRRALRFDPSPQHRHRILRLLADDYLRSGLTGRRYEAGSKARAGDG